MKALDPIIAGAKGDRAYAEAVKAVALKIALEGRIEGNKPEEKITRLQAEMKQQPAAMQPALEAILAHWYWQYYQTNRWRFMQRTQTAAGSGPDLLTWDLPHILAEIDLHFRRALADEKRLEATPISAYDALLDRGNVPDIYRPTLFDFLAHEALQFYTAGEQAGAAAEDAFVLESESPIFAPAAAFLKWRPDASDTTSVTLAAIRLYQKLLAFHRNDKDKSAFAAADLERLVFGRNKAAGEDTDDRFKAALKQFVDAHAGHEISSTALAEWARLLHREGEFVEARRLAQRGAQSFPASAGATTCFNLIQQIEAKSASIQTERVWNEPLPSISVTYRNITKVYFRAVSYDFESRIESRGFGIEFFEKTAREELLSRVPAREWNADLPATLDYRERTEQVPAPRGLAPGFYVIIASHDPSFGDQNNQVSIAPIWVSDLALVIRPAGDGTVQGFVLQARTGEPIRGATIESWKGWDYGKWKPDERTTTDRDGWFRVAGYDRHRVILLASHAGQRLSSSDAIHARHWSSEGKEHRTIFFTDRSLYRPGQTIHYKGIHIHVDTETNDYRTLAGEPIKVVFSDANGQEIAHERHVCNDYGSFSGTFIAPRDRLTGTMSIRGPDGAIAIQVEEYKRPKFQVEVAAPKEAAKLDAEVVVMGKAVAYTGAPIGGAKVRWQVVRGASFPAWCWWGRGRSQAIARGIATTENDGSFTVRFVAKPDRKIPEKDEPTFGYQINADVTDTSGETRSAGRNVRIGYTALQASLTADAWLTSANPVALTIETRSLDGEPQPARGTVKIYQLEQPVRVLRASFERPRHFDRYALKMDAEPQSNPSDPNSWRLGALLAEKPFATGDEGKTQIALDLPAGIYRAMLETQDRFGKPVRARLLLQVMDPKAGRFPIKIADHLAAPAWSVEPGGRLVALWGTGYDTGRAIVEIEHHGKLLRRYWTAAGRTQEVIQHRVGEELRGGFTLRVTAVRENRAFLNERTVDVPWSNKQLSVTWERFRSKLVPGQKEKWIATVRGPKAEKAAVEMVAGLYDASLDAYQPHGWQDWSHVFRREHGSGRGWFANSALGFQHIMGSWPVESRREDVRDRAFPSEIVADALRLGLHVRGGRSREVSVRSPADINLPPSMPDSEMLLLPGESVSEAVVGNTGVAIATPAPTQGPDLDRVHTRQNLTETAFFLPHLRSDAHGDVTMEFTLPEALTEWKFMGFAHDRALRSGFLTDRATTSKDLMVEPNPPRFVREGDVIEFTVKITNRTTERQTGRVKLAFVDARRLASMDAALGNTRIERDFDLPGNESRTESWRLTVPDGCEFLIYKAVGATATQSDGEEGFLPVLSRRIVVTESLPLPIRGRKTQSFEFTKLLESAASTSLRHQSLTVQMVSQPAWYAVMALPYLMEYPHECSEQIFNRLYANALARHIAGSDPRIRSMFDRWKGTPALESPLEKNEALKSVMLEATPWLVQARAESEARRNVGILFDSERLVGEMSRTLRKLSEAQQPEGLWPWFPGGDANAYISLYIATGFGRLRHLGVDVDTAPALKALPALDHWMAEQYREIKRHGNLDRNHLNYTIAFYLYGRSFFLKDLPVTESEAFEYWLGQARTYWLGLQSRQSQAHVAIGLQRLGDAKTPLAILRSIREHAVRDPELGMFWRDLEASWWWYRAPIETQASMIEAFDEVAHDSVAVEECKVWLLKQKQTQDWKTTKATADAVYALLLRGTGMLASDALVEVTLAGETIRPATTEAGTGFYEHRFVRDEVRPALGKITVKKTDEGVSWGSAHWQYLEDVSKVRPHTSTPLRLKKTLFVREPTNRGLALRPVTGPLAVGDELIVRVELRTDRDMEYVHLEDQRASGTEPVNVLSGRRYQDGLAYYESTRDTASHFFIDYLPKGTYVFEYATRIQHRGTYPTGVAAIQCMYAPEFNSHSESFDLQVQ